GIAAFLSLGYVPDPLAAFAGVAKLSPGHVLTWSAQRGAAVRRYWTPVASESALTDETLAVQRLRDLLAAAVGSHLEAEVPLGAPDVRRVVARAPARDGEPVRRRRGRVIRRLHALRRHVGAWYRARVGASPAPLGGSGPPAHRAGPRPPARPRAAPPGRVCGHRRPATATGRWRARRPAPRGARRTVRGYPRRRVCRRWRP